MPRRINTPKPLDIRVLSRIKTAHIDRFGKAHEIYGVDGMPLPSGVIGMKYRLANGKKFDLRVRNANADLVLHLTFYRVEEALIFQNTASKQKPLPLRGFIVPFTKQKRTPPHNNGIDARNRRQTREFEIVRARKKFLKVFRF